MSYLILKLILLLLLFLRRNLYVFLNGLLFLGSTMLLEFPLSVTNESILDSFWEVTALSPADPLTLLLFNLT